MKRKNEIALRKLRFILRSALLVIIVLVAYFVVEFYSEDSFRKVEKLRDNTAAGISTLINEIVNDIDELSMTIGLEDDFDYTTLQLYTSILMEEVTYLAGLSVAYIPGVIDTSVVPQAFAFFQQKDSTIEFNLAQPFPSYRKEDWFTVPMLLNKGIWLEPEYVSFYSNKLLIPYSKPIFRFSMKQHNRFIGIIGGWIDITLLHGVLENLPLREREIVLIISRSGSIISSSINAVNWRQKRNIFSLTEEYNNLKLKDILHSMFQNGIKGTSIFDKPFSATDAVTYTPLAGGNYFLLIFFRHN